MESESEPESNEFLESEPESEPGIIFCLESEPEPESELYQRVGVGVVKIGATPDSGYSI